MHKIGLLIIGILLLNIGFSQVQQVKLKNPIIYEIGEKADSLIFLPANIELEVAEWEYDSCTYYSNTFQFEFEIKNMTQKPVLCNKELKCWNDSGLTFTGQLNGEPMIIKPGQTAKILVKVMPYHKKRMSTTNQFIVIQGEDQLLVPIHLSFANTSFKKCLQENFLDE